MFKQNNIETIRERITLLLSEKKISNTRLGEILGSKGSGANQSQRGSRFLKKLELPDLLILMDHLNEPLDSILFEKTEKNTARTIIQGVAGNVMSGGQNNTMSNQSEKSEFEKILDMKDSDLKNRAMDYFLSNK